MDNNFVLNNEKIIAIFLLSKHDYLLEQSTFPDGGLLWRLQVFPGFPELFLEELKTSVFKHLLLNWGHAQKGKKNNPKPKKQTCKREQKRMVSSILPYAFIFLITKIYNIFLRQMKPCPIWRTSTNIFYDYHANSIIQKFIKAIQY